MIKNNDENNRLALASKFINNTNRHVFLTGKAGTGKTTFLKYIIHHTFKNVVVAAPTGIAAINAGGVTLHSLFLLPFGSFVPTNDNAPAFSEHLKINNKNSLLRELKMHKNKRKLLQEMELLIIDEVSMLRSDLLDAIDTILQSVRRNRRTFGGVQLLFIGDLLQLPPVVKDAEWRILKQYYKSQFFFDAYALADNPPLYIELEKIYRQTDNTFINILNNLRNNTVNEHDVEVLNKHYQPDFKPKPTENYIKLTTHNNSADLLNNTELSKIKNPSYFFKAEIKGDFNENAYPLELTLELKKGAQIMFVKNDPSGGQRFFNGKIGLVSAISDDEIEVEFEDLPEGKAGKTTPITVDKYVWENIKYKVNDVTNEIVEDVVGTFTQYPIKLAWAITVHKSQGLTFDKAIIDVEHAFAPGQVYVALSRLTSLEGLVLSSKINFKNLTSDETVASFGKTKPTEDTLNNLLTNESQQFLKNYIVTGFDFNFLQQQLFMHVNSYGKREGERERGRSEKQQYFDWANQLMKDVDSIKETADKFINQVNQIFAYQKPDYQTTLLTRVNSAKEYFLPLLKTHSKAILGKIEEVSTKKKVKAYLQELVDLDGVFYKQIQSIQKVEALLKSSLNNVEFTKENIGLNHADRIKEVALVNTAKEIVSKEKKEKKEKIDTKKVTFDLYKAGKSIAEIAKERAFATTTIEGHLAHYVGLGLININEFVNEEKRKTIVDAIKKLDTNLLGEIKHHLGEDFSYPEIKCTLAYYQNANKV
jgi:energy-coupling factor transporter ATP-binding protein EcfA2